MNTIIINSGSKILHIIRQAIITFELSHNKLLIFLQDGLVVEFQTPDEEYEGINPVLSGICEKIKNFLNSTASVHNLHADIPYRIVNFGGVVDTADSEIDKDGLIEKLQQVIDLAQTIPYDPKAWDKTVKSDIYTNTRETISQLAKLQLELKN